MSWQYISNHISWPSLKSFREDGVIGVRTATSGDVPCLHEKNVEDQINEKFEKPFLLTVSQSTPSSSTKILINSGIAKAG
jgi:hypothetical protein